MANDWDTIDDWYTDEFTVSVTYDGYPLRGILHSSENNYMAVAAGLQNEYTHSIRLRADECEGIGWTPSPDDTVTVEDTDRIVTLARQNSTRTEWILDLEETTPRA